MSSPWPVVHREDARVDAAEALGPDLQPPSVIVEDGVPEANLELFSYTRTSWMVPLSASVMIERLWLRQASCQIGFVPSNFVSDGSRNNFCAFAKSS